MYHQKKRKLKKRIYSSESEEILNYEPSSITTFSSRVLRINQRAQGKKWKPYIRRKLIDNARFQREANEAKISDTCTSANPYGNGSEILPRLQHWSGVCKSISKNGIVQIAAEYLLSGR